MTESSEQNGVLLAIGGVVAVGVIGAIFAGEHTVTIIGFCTLVSVQLLAYLQSMRAADKAEEVKTALLRTEDRANERDSDNRATLNGISNVASSTHELVNSEKGKLLSLYAIAARRIANSTNSDADDRAAADIAEQLSGEHEKKAKDN